MLTDDSTASKPLTVALLHELLKDIESWNRFGLHLEGITTTHIEIIKEDKKNESDESKLIALFEKWLRVCPEATWEKVINALKIVEENTLAKKVAIAVGYRKNTPQSTAALEEEEVMVKKRTVTRLTKLNESYADLFIESKHKIKSAVENNKVSLDELMERVRPICRSLNTIDNITTVDRLIAFLSSYCFFLNCSLLLVLVKSIEESDLAKRIDDHCSKVDSFLESVSIRSLHRSLERFVKVLPHESSIRVRVHNVYNNEKLELVEDLLSILFRIERNDISRRFIVAPGSVLIEVFLSSHMLLHLITNSARKKQFMEIIGVVSLQIGTVSVMRCQETENYTFEAGLISSIELGNMEAFLFLLNHVQIDVNMQLVDDQSLIISNEAAISVKEVVVEDSDAEPPLTLCDDGTIVYKKLQLEQEEAHPMDVCQFVYNGNMYYKADSGRTALIEACRLSDLRMTKSLLEKGADPNIQTKTGWTALIYAASMGCIEIAALLLNYSANVNLKKTSNRATALIYAALSGNPKMVKMLLKYKAEPDEVMTNGVTPLIVACREGHSRVVRALLNAKVDPEKKMSNDVTPLLIASENGHSEVVEQLLEKDVEINAATKIDNTTPLLASCKTGQLKVVEQLLSKGANIKTERFDGTTPLLVASMNGHLDVVERILQEGVDPNIPMVNGVTPIYIASQKGHLKIVERLIEANAIPTRTTEKLATPLYIASHFGHLDIVDRLLQLPDVVRYENLNMRRKNGTTALFIACHNGHLNVVRRLLLAGANPNISASDNASPLFVACQQGHFRIVEVLLDAKVSVHTRKRDGGTPLLVACMEGYDDIVQLLLKAGASPNTCSNSPLGTPLLVAIEKGNLKMIKELIKFQADPELTDFDGRTPMFIACQNGHDDIVEILLQANADPNRPLDEAVTPLLIASHQGHTEVVKKLLNAKVDPNVPMQADNSTPLFLASQEGHAKIVELLLKSNADPTICFMNQATPLYIASQNGHSEIVEMLLLANKAIIDHATDEGETPLFAACKHGHLDIVEKLLKAKANPEIQKAGGATPLFIASQEGRVNIVKRLLQEGVNASTPRDTGATPLHIACSQGHVEVVQELLLVTVDADSPTSDGSTPLFLACKSGHVEIVKMLLSTEGVDPDSPAGNGLTPLIIASENAHTEVVKLLLDNGADRSLKTADLETNTLEGHSALTKAVQMRKKLRAELRQSQHDESKKEELYCKEQSYNEIIEMLK